MSGLLEVVHHDNHLLVVNKPAGLPTVPDDSGDESLLERAKAWVGETYHKPGAVFLGVVHRLDRPVSGLVVLARTSKAARRLTAAFAERRVEKIYWGVAARCPEPPQGSLEQWLVKDRERNRVHVVEAGAENAKLAHTDWNTLERGPRSCLIELRPSSGRAHQLRVAMASLGAPLLGDLRYGASEPLPDRSVALHALLLELPHPTRSERLRFEVPPPTQDPGIDPSPETWSHAHCRRARERGVRVSSVVSPS